MRNTRRAAKSLNPKREARQKTTQMNFALTPKPKKKTFDNSAADTAAAVVNAAATCSRDRLHLQLTRSRRAASYFG